jgi:hypothetical protein
MLPDDQPPVQPEPAESVISRVLAAAPPRAFTPHERDAFLEWSLALLATARADPDFAWGLAEMFHELGRLAGRDSP